jgi:dihydrofolate reductase
MFTVIAATDRLGAIGKNNQLPWRLPGEMAHFKASTTGKTVLMGYNTAVSIGKALPNRTNLVLSAKHDDAPFAKQIHMRTLNEVLAFNGAHFDEEIMVIGGESVYRSLLPKASKVILTEVDLVVEGADAWFPYIEEFKSNGQRWLLESEVHHPADDKNQYGFTIRTYVFNDLPWN